MADPAILAELLAFVIKNAPAWLSSLGGTLLEKQGDVALEKGEEILFAGGKRLGRRILHLDEKERIRHLEQALKNATERGFLRYQTLQERELYYDVVHTLSQQGASGDALRYEVMRLFALSEEPDLAALSDIYINAQPYSQTARDQHLDVTHCLTCFFSALLGELYADPYFRPQLSNALQLRAFKQIDLSLRHIVSVLQQMGGTLSESYTAENLVHDIDIYSTHLERTLHHLKIVGIVSKDKNVDPELGSIFVPLRVVSTSPESAASYVLRKAPATVQKEYMYQTPLISLLEQSRLLVLLGGPGSGKSTATKHLAWSHVVASHLSSASVELPLLSGHPLPLRLELRTLSEMRKRANYDFLSFASDVLLKREGVDIHPQMFKELLARRGMVLIFDGLDEVSTLDERLGLVKEIEHFALRYPGNRILVTSRPVEYDLARFSHPLFFHAEVQPFDEMQIQQFLEKWYTAVLGFSPLPQQEREEMSLLLTTLKENARLHTLAENPLLLTVMTQLHRHERLPDRRVQVYDRCADLLLETWAKLRGTLHRWQDMKMIKEEQHACVAFLGLTLHERSQETKGAEDQTVDVSARFLHKRVVDFLRERHLITEGSEQQTEARRFVELIQEEAGLIVERGIDENGEVLYSFVHRTFQEYFAAADIYERYLQSEDTTVISTFLREHLHDPHWREVIMLLLGKLKSAPVTRQLRYILQGETKSQRSHYTEIVQQDLFFVCSCLVEEIKVENTLVELVVASLKKVIQSTWSPAQRREALGFLGALMQTRLYRDQAREALCLWAKKQAIFDEMGKLAIIEALYLHSAPLSEERRVAMELLTDLTQQSDLSVESIWKTAEFLYGGNPAESEAEHLGATLLRELIQRPDLSVGHVWRTAEALYRRSLAGSEAEHLGATLLRELLQRPDLPVEQQWKIAEALYRRSLAGSEAEHLGATLLRELIQRPDLPVEQRRKTAEDLYCRDPADTEAHQLGMALLKELVQQPDLPAEQIRAISRAFSDNSLAGTEAHQLGTTLLKELIARADLSVEQRWKTAEAFCRRDLRDSEAYQQGATLLKELVQRPDLSVKQIQATAEALYRRSLAGSEIELLGIILLRELIQRPDLPVEQIRAIAEVLYDNSPASSEAQHMGTLVLRELLQRPDLSVEQRWQTAEALCDKSPVGSEEACLGTAQLKELVRQPDLSVEQRWKIAEALCESNPAESEAQQVGMTQLKELVERPDLSVEQRWKIAESLSSGSVVGEEAQQVGITVLKELVRQPDLSMEQQWKIAESLYDGSPIGSEMQRLGATLLRELMQQPVLPVEQRWRIAEMLYRRSPEGSDEKWLVATFLREMVHQPDLSVEQIQATAVALYHSSLADSKTKYLGMVLLKELVQRPDLSVEQRQETAETLYRRSPAGSEAEHLGTMILWELVQQPDLSVEQRWQGAEALYRHSLAGSEAQQAGITLLWALVQQPDLPVEQIQATSVALYHSSSTGEDTKLLATHLLLKQLSHRGMAHGEGDVYRILRDMVPQFHKLQ